MFNIIYEDSDIIIIDKKNNVIVNNEYNNKIITLSNIIEEYFPKIKNVNRYGIVHRLDKDTTGLLVIAKNNYSHYKLLKSFYFKNIFKKYLALVSGCINYSGKIDKGIIRDKNKKISMTVSDKGKKSITYYKIIKKFKLFTYINIITLTGRTHQIRVHMKHIKHPVIGDIKYGHNISNFDIISNIIKKNNIFLNRYLLHSYILGFNHPVKNKFMVWKSEIPFDMFDFMNNMKYY